jgi:ankyrin repeat protein
MIKLERIQLDEDDNNPPYGQTVEKGFLAIESFRPQASLYALDLFSSFMKEVARTMDEPIHGQGEIRPNDARSLGSWTSFTLHNTLLSKLTGEIQSTGLATLSEVYAAIIPSLSMENKLPLVDNIVELAREHARPHEERGDMKKATEVYIWLIKTARLFPHDTSFVPKSTAVVLDHLGQLNKSNELLDRLRPIALPPRFFNLAVIIRKETPLQEQIENELQLGEPERRSLLIRLMLLYDGQHRLHIIPSQFIDIAHQDPAFLQQRRSLLPRKYEEGTEKRDITGWTQLHRAAAGGYTFPLARLLEKDIDLDSRDLLGQTALHLACQASEIGAATILARRGADINARTRNGSTPLHYAAKRADMPIIKLIVESGAELDAMDSVRMTPAMWAAFEGWKNVLSYLWKNSNLNLRDSGGRAILHHAVLSGHSGLVDVFEEGVDTEVRDHQGRTPLQLAALCGNEDAFWDLKIKLQADIGALDDGGRHLLHFAAVGGQMTVMNQLVKTFNADINCRDMCYETPLHLVVREGKHTVIETLMELGANLEARSRNGETPLMTACILGKIEIVQRLIGFGADTNTVTNFGSSALSEAALYCRRKVVECLLKSGVDKDSQNQTGQTALHTAAIDGPRKIVQLIIDAGAEKERSDNGGMTALHHAAIRGSTAVTKVLLMAGADKEAKDKNGMTPLHWAASGLRTVSNRKRERIVKLLLEAGAERQTVSKKGKTARQLAEEVFRRRLVEIIDMF